MEKLIIALPDGAEKEIGKGTIALDIAREISPSLAKKAVAAKLNDTIIDLSQPLEESGQLQILTSEDEEALLPLRHSAAQVMAQALQRLYPGIHFGVGPVIENGFYYDVDSEKTITEEDLKTIEDKMMEIVKENLPIIRKEVSRKEAEEIFAHDPYKLELIHDLPADEKLTVYEQGEYVDLCRGPHVPSTGRIQVFKLLSLAGAYWRGNSNNKMMQRIYGTAFFDKKA